MGLMDALLREHERRAAADQKIRLQAERILALEAQLAQEESNKRALITQTDELRALIKQMALEPLGLWCPPEPPEPIDELTHRLWTPDDAVNH